MSMNGSVLSPLQRDASCMSELKSTSKCLRMHLNSLWSIWYGIFITLLNGYIAIECSKRFFDYLDQLKEGEPDTFQYELYTCIGLTGFAALLIPFFFASALFKVGNLANDGFKLGKNMSACSADASNGVVITGRSGCHRMWQHCGPTASLFHLIIAFCFLIPKLIIEARSIQTGLLSKSMIWKTDLDFLIPHEPIPSFRLNFTTASAMPTTSHADTTVPVSQLKPLPLSVTPGQEILISDDTNFGSVSIEFLNYALALFIYSVRYPSVFWSTNKYFGILFSLQLLVNSVQCLLMHVGVCVLYKVHVVGSKETIPFLSSRLSKWALRFGTPFILNKEVTIALYVMSVILILVSSLVLYLYGYGRLNSFLNREKARRIISLKDTYSGRTWGYFTHCAALCILVAIGVCEAPLLYDFTLIYRGSVDMLVLIVILSSILHLFIWVLLWLILTLKQHWEFKLRVTVGHATVRNAHSIRLITDVQLMSANTDAASAPLLVVGHGRTYTVADAGPKKAIMTVIQKATMEKKLKAGHASSCKAPSDDGEEQIYWLRPKSRTPRNSPDSSSSETRFGWFTKKKGEKATVEEMAVLTKASSRKAGSLCGEDDGDYVRLREIPGIGQVATITRADHGDDTASEDNKLMESVRSDRVTYASVNKDLLNPTCREYEDPSPLLTPEPHDHDDLPPPPPELSVSVNQCNMSHSVHGGEHPDLSKCLHRSDSGMAAEEMPSHSDSEISGGSPPDRTCSNSETSSGIHSNSSRDSETHKPAHDQSAAPIFNEATQKIHPQQWIQRNIIHSPPPYSNNRVYKPQQHYAVANKTPVINEVAEESSTVVIRRKSSMNVKPPTVALDATNDRFCRSTNMRLTSFTDYPEQNKVSATLPHYPTSQPIGVPYQHCSTMPLPVSSAGCNLMANGGSCSSFPRPHTTIPTHHNGIRLCNQANPHAKYTPLPSLHHGYPAAVENQHCALNASHHTFPQIPVHPAKYYLQRNAERDSANFSMGSSGDSDVCNGTAVS